MKRKATDEEKEVLVLAIREERILAKDLPEVQSKAELKVLDRFIVPLRFISPNWDGLYN